MLKYIDGFSVSNEKGQTPAVQKYNK